MNQPPNLLRGTGGGVQVYTLDESEEHSRAIIPSCPNNSCQYIDSFFALYYCYYYSYKTFLTNRISLQEGHWSLKKEVSSEGGEVGDFCRVLCGVRASTSSLVSDKASVKVFQRWTNERGELTGSCRWPDWVWEITNQSNFKTSEKLLIILEEFQYYTTPY